MDTTFKNNQNTVIKYRNLLLKSKGIEPKIYFFVVDYFDKKYAFFRDKLVLKTSDSIYGYGKIIEVEVFLGEIVSIFGVSYEISINIYEQLFSDNELHKIMSEDVKSNWLYLSLPNIHEEQQDYPF